MISGDEYNVWFALRKPSEWDAGGTGDIIKRARITGNGAIPGQVIRWSPRFRIRWAAGEEKYTSTLTMQKLIGPIPRISD